MGFLSMFENDKRKVENIVSKEVEKIEVDVTAVFQ